MEDILGWMLLLISSTTSSSLQGQLVALAQT